MIPGLALDSGEFIPAAELNRRINMNNEVPTFYNRQAIEREIESIENPHGMRLNDAKERPILPGGSLRRLLVVIDAQAERVAELEAQTAQLTASLETASSAVIVLKQQQRERRAQLASGREPVAWMVFWGLGQKRPGAIFVEREHAVSHAKQIKSETEICPVYAHPASTGISQADCLWARNGNTPCTSSPAQQPLSEDQIVAAARALNRQSSRECGINEQDSWNLYADEFLADAKAALEAAHGIKETP